MALEQISIFGWANGLSSLLILFSAIVVGMLILIRTYRSETAELTHYGLGLVVILLGIQWFVAGTGVILLAFFDYTYSDFLYFLILTTALGFGAPLVAYVIFSPDFFTSKWLIYGPRVFIGLIAIVVFIIEILVSSGFLHISEVFFVDHDSYPSGVIQSTYKGLLRISVVIAMLFLLFFSIMLLYTSWKIPYEYSQAKFRSFTLGLGFLLFFCFAFLDALLELDPVPLFIIRAMIAFSFIMLYISITMPKPLLKMFFKGNITT